MAKTPSVSEDIESVCSKCGDVWHVVVAVVSDAVCKVQCKECGREHRHKLGVAGKVAKPRAVKKAGPLKSARQPAGPAVKVDESRPVRNYRIDLIFSVGDRVNHLKFGLGVVEEILDTQKVQIYFTDGRRILAQGKPGAAAAV